MTLPGPGAGKPEWRSWARRTRSKVDLERVSQRVVAALSSWLPRGARVLLYDPLPDEVDVTSLAEPGHAFLTRTPEDGRLTVHPFESRRERHRLGFSQPVADSETVDPETIDIVLVPGLAFDRRGVRLGRGTGHYDRLLPGLRSDAIVVGVTPAALVVDRLPREGHDVSVTHLATEGGVVDLLIEAAIAWIEADPDPETRASLKAMVAAGDRETLAAHMVPLEFGTAGIRAKVGPGPARMNRAVVIRTSSGLGAHLAATGRAGCGIVVGHDARPDSARFAADAAAVFAAAGFEVRCFDEVTPTPLVAHAALRSGAGAAVVVTASHNPPADNGYKVYDANGAQIVPPADAAIAAEIAAAPPADSVPRRQGVACDDPGDAQDAYLSDVLAFRRERPVPGTVPIVYTAMHGVGGRLAVRLLAEGGHTRVTPVPEQFDPDGSFPTVAFPNPEEPGALDLALRLGSEMNAGLVLANDPDADRLAAAVPEGEGWRVLDGNEIGVLLADFVLERTSGEGRLVAESVVSTPMLAAVARHHGAALAVTLTGFKWICNAALDLEGEGKRFVFGFEEALGYSVGPVVRDKDGISAALWFADLATVAAADGETVLDRLDRLAVRHGLWVSSQHAVVLPGAAGAEEITAAMSRLAADPPDSVAGRSVVSVTDYSRGQEDRPRWLPATSLVALDLEGGSRVLARPSGTEPKLKFYADLRFDVASATDARARRPSARREAERLAASLAEVMGL
ncbi:MAG: 5-formyltetrahydrofolate cyclo-ligase [Acidimicrobiia bacterium]|nr:MAG: 5-formyltetrahydrofolate cyclo-ligase [Acidimicrobiia bacterium]